MGRESFATFVLPIYWHSHWHWHFFFQHFNNRSTHLHYSLHGVHRLQIEDLLMYTGTKHRIAMGNVAVNTKCSTGETWPIMLMSELSGFMARLTITWAHFIKSGMLASPVVEMGCMLNCITFICRGSGVTRAWTFSGLFASLSASQHYI